MKLATLREGGRDGTLVVVSRDLTTATKATSVTTLQGALDSWEEHAPQLAQLSDALNSGNAADVFPFDPTACHSPLPRAYQWADGSAYVTHVELVRKARGAKMPDSFWTDPLMYQGGSDRFIGPRDPAPFSSEEWGIDFEAEVAVVTDDVPMGVSVEAAADHIKLVMLVNDWSLRGLIPGELSKGFGFFQSKPASSFSPVAVTPDELGNEWRGSKLHLPLLSSLNGEVVGRPNAGVDMTFNFAQLIAHAAKTRELGSGAVVGSGTVSNQGGKVGSSCLAEVRMLEKIKTGEIQTPFLRFGDRVKIEMVDAEGNSLFGAIDQEVIEYIHDRTKEYASS